MRDQHHGPTSPGRAAVFLDRDGVIIEEVGYLADPEQIVLIAGAAEAIAAVNRRRVPVIVVTNQSGVARGKYPESRVREVHARLDQYLAAAGARIDHYDYCPHHPTAGQGAYRVDCACRKPKPGMLQRAAAELGVDLASSFLVGDKRTDLDAGAAVGCRTMLVRTGYGRTFEAGLQTKPPRFLGVVNTLADALPRILGEINDPLRAA